MRACIRNRRTCLPQRGTSSRLSAVAGLQRRMKQMAMLPLRRRYGSCERLKSEPGKVVSEESQDRHSTVIETLVPGSVGPSEEDSRCQVSSSG